MGREVDLSRQTTLLLSALRDREGERPWWLPWSSLSCGERCEWITIAVVVMLIGWWVS